MTRATDVMHVVERLAGKQLELLGASSGFVTRDHGAVHFYDIKGRGGLPPLVVLHGLSAGAATQYSLLLPHLKPHFSRIIAPELPGHGLSALPPEGMSGEALLSALEDTLEATCRGPVILFGSSLGGAVATRFAARHPRQVSRLVLCSPAGAPIAPVDRETFLSRFRIHSHADALAFVDRIFPQRPRLRQLLAFGIRQQFNRPHIRALLSELDDRDFLTTEELEGLPMPVLFLWGGADDVLLPSQRDFFLAHLPRHAQIDLPEEFGHTPFLDRTAETAERLLDFAGGLTVGTARTTGPYREAGAA